MKKIARDIILHMCTKNHNHVMYRYQVTQTEFFVILDHFLPFYPCILSNYAHVNQGSINLVIMCATYQPGIVGTQPSVIQPVVVNGSNLHHRCPRVSPSIIWNSFTDFSRMEDWVGLAARGGRKICWYYLQGESNLGSLHNSTMVHPLCYSCQTRTNSAQEPLGCELPPYGPRKSKF